MCVIHEALRSYNVLLHVGNIPFEVALDTG